MKWKQIEILKEQIAQAYISSNIFSRKEVMVVKPINWLTVSSFTIYGEKL